METNEHDILLEIFRFLRDYSTSTYTLFRVIKELSGHLDHSGYTVDILPRAEKNSRILRVNGHGYKIVYNDGWSKYDVVRTIDHDMSIDYNSTTNKQQKIIRRIKP